MCVSVTNLPVGGGGGRGKGNKVIGKHTKRRKRGRGEEREKVNELVEGRKGRREGGRRAEWEYKRLTYNKRGNCVAS